MQQAAASVPENTSPRPSLFLDLPRGPLWPAGAAMSVFSYVVQDIALAFGSLALVLPPAARDLVFAPPMVARHREKRLTRRVVRPAGVHRGTAA
ncbi:hypothetical protein [Streptomyces incanus]|uniref:Uncharacterized protein n=1 Tax=Streptomyces incanus TaxID=887453 RepID=A0ABW0XX90_9ACTN